jgi:hypothetical protein
MARDSNGQVRLDDPPHFLLPLNDVLFQMNKGVSVGKKIWIHSVDLPK